MTRHEAFQLLRDIASADHRTVAETDVDFWHDCLDDVDFDDARAAVVQHFRTSTSWLMPAHIRTAVTRIRTVRIAAVPQPDPGPELADHPRDYALALRAQLAELANGKSVRTAITRSLPPAPEARAHAEARCNAIAEAKRVAGLSPTGHARGRGLSSEELAAIQSAEFRAAREQQEDPPASALVTPAPTSKERSGSTCHYD